MNALVVYDSVYGNTKEIAEAIAGVLEQHGSARVTATGSATVSDFVGIDLLALGGPTQNSGLSPAMKKFFEKIPAETFSGLSVVAFDTRIRISKWLSGSAAERIDRVLRRQGIGLLVPPQSFFVAGTEGPLEDGENERAQEWANTTLQRITPTAVAAG